MIIGVGGDLGSGKTIFIVILGLIYHEYYQDPEKIKQEKKTYIPFKGVINLPKKEPVTKYNVYSNFDTTYSKKVNPLDFMKKKVDLSNCLILLTEAHTFFDSRISGSTANRLQGYFYLQTRKRNTHVIYDAQILSSVDLRLRYVSDYYVLAEQNKKGFVYTLFKKEEPVKQICLSREYAKKHFYNVYNSYEVITPFLSSNIPFKEIEEYYGDSPNKKSFTVLIRSQYPTLTYDVAGSIFDFMKVEKFDRVKQLLGSEIIA